MMDINWYPGHMAKTRRELSESLKNVDLAAEIVDARIPRSSRNPVLDELLGEKPRIVILNRRDLAKSEENSRWLEFFKKSGTPAFACDAKSGAGCSSFEGLAKAALADLLERREGRGVSRNLKVMVVGIPNVGKSSFINRVSGGKPAKAEDRPGVTRKQQWIRLKSGIDLLDTPGMLWPKIEDPAAGERLAFTGAVRDDIIDIETLAVRLLAELRTIAPEQLEARFKIDPRGMGDGELFEAVARRRGLLIRGGEPDSERTARILLDEFRSGRLGRITLELAEGM